MVPEGLPELVGRQCMASGGHGCRESGFLSWHSWAHSCPEGCLYVTAFSKNVISETACVSPVSSPWPLPRAWSTYRVTHQACPYHSILILIRSPSGLLVFPEKRKDKGWYGGRVGARCADTTWVQLKEIQGGLTWLLGPATQRVRMAAVIVLERETYIRFLLISSQLAYTQQTNWVNYLCSHSRDSY